MLIFLLFLFIAVNFSDSIQSKSWRIALPQRHMRSIHAKSIHGFKLSTICAITDKPSIYEFNPSHIGNYLHYSLYLESSIISWLDSQFSNQHIHGQIGRIVKDSYQLLMRNKDPRDPDLRTLIRNVHQSILSIERNDAIVSATPEAITDKLVDIILSSLIDLDNMDDDLKTDIRLEITEFDHQTFNKEGLKYRSIFDRYVLLRKFINGMIIIALLLSFLTNILILLLLFTYLL